VILTQRIEALTVEVRAGESKAEDTFSLCLCLCLSMPVTVVEDDVSMANTSVASVLSEPFGWN
jgi:hypothetical protein